MVRQPSAGNRRWHLSSWGIYVSGGFAVSGVVNELLYLKTVSNTVSLRSIRFAAVPEIIYCGNTAASILCQGDGWCFSRESGRSTRHRGYEGMVRGEKKEELDA
jgi:hypothetical protein